jgi:hypothetical protein
MPTQNPAQGYDVFKFRLFRINVIRFLKLPFDVSEGALRNIIKESSINLLANYEARAELARAGLRAPEAASPTR